MRAFENERSLCVTNILGPFFNNTHFKLKFIKKKNKNNPQQQAANNIINLKVEGKNVTKGGGDKSKTCKK